MSARVGIRLTEAERAGSAPAGAATLAGLALPPELAAAEVRLAPLAEARRGRFVDGAKRAARLDLDDERLPLWAEPGMLYLAADEAGEADPRAAAALGSPALRGRLAAALFPRRSRREPAAAEGEEDGPRSARDVAEAFNERAAERNRELDAAIADAAEGTEDPERRRRLERLRKRLGVGQVTRFGCDVFSPLGG